MSPFPTRPVSDGGAAPHLAMDFRALGIAVDVERFLEPERVSSFRQRLAKMDLDSDEPVATVIFAHSPAGVARMIEARPDGDFYLPESLQEFAARATASHSAVPGSADRFFLLAYGSRSLRLDRSCRM